MTPFDLAIDKARNVQLQRMLPGRFVPDPVDATEGMALVCEDTPLGKAVGVTTLAFARQFCADDPYYTWRKL